MDFAVLVDHRVKLKESEKKDEYLDFAKELKKTKELQIVIGVLGTVTRVLIMGLKDMEIRGRVKSTQTTV